MCECVAEESVGYPVRLSSTLTAQLSLPSLQLVEAFDSDGCVMLRSEISQLFGQEPSVRADVVALSSTESAKLQSCYSTMPSSISVFLQYGAAVLVSDLPQRDVASKVELLQNHAAPLVHHGDSNAIGVLVYADHAVRESCGWRRLLKQPQETVATSHQNACGNPTVSQMFLQTSVCTVSLDWKPEAFMVGSEAQDGVSTFGRLPTKEPFVKSYCWMFDLRSDLASLPSVPLGFLDQLAGYAVGLDPILRVDDVVQLIVCGSSVVLNCLKGVRCKRFEDAVRLLEFAVLAVREWQKVELQDLLRRYLPPTDKCCANHFNWRATRNCSAIPLHAQRQEFPCGDFYELVGQYYEGFADLGNGSNQSFRAARDH